MLQFCIIYDQTFLTRSIAIVIIQHSLVDFVSFVAITRNLQLTLMIDVLFNYRVSNVLQLSHLGTYV